MDSLGMIVGNNLTIITHEGNLKTVLKLFYCENKINVLKWCKLKCRNRNNGYIYTIFLQLQTTQLGRSFLINANKFFQCFSSGCDRVEKHNCETNK